MPATNYGTDTLGTGTGGEGAGGAGDGDGRGLGLLFAPPDGVGVGDLATADSLGAGDAAVEDLLALGCAAFRGAFLAVPGEGGSLGNESIPKDAGLISA